MSSAGVGVDIPKSKNLQTAYSGSLYADLGSGLKITDQFSVWLDFNLGLFNSQNDQLTNYSDFTLIEAAFWARYRIFNSDISPYVFIGPGISYNEYRSNQGAIVDYDIDYAYIPINAYEFDFLAEGGIGLEMRVGGGITTFLQGKLTYDFTSSSFAGYGSTDSPTIVMPFELGMIFGI